MQTRPTSLERAGLAAFGTAVAASLAGTVLYGIHGSSSEIFGRSVYRGSPDRRTLALTFDDGPNPGTLPLLEYLASEGISATFFQCGTNVRRSPEIARTVLAAGHEVGNHTFTHPRLCPRLGWPLNLHGPGFIHQQLQSTQDILLSETGARPVLFRAPYGMRWFGLAEAQRRLGLTGVMWTVIGHDWEWPASRIIQHILRHSSPGGIICLHDGRDIQPDPDLSGVLAALKIIIPSLKADGYTFSTVSELISTAEASGISAPLPSHAPLAL